MGREPRRGENLRSLGYAGDYIVMPNGVDLPRGKASPEAVDALSRKWALPADKPVYLFIGRIMWYKGLRIILDGLKKVRDAGGDFCMVFVGDGQDRPAVEGICRTARSHRPLPLHRHRARPRHDPRMVYPRRSAALPLDVRHERPRRARGGGVLARQRAH